MRVHRLTGPGQSQVVDASAPEPGPRQAVIEVTACGVCASELHPWATADTASLLHFGHEPIGIVRAVGSEVTSVTAGDRVTGLFTGAYSECCLADEDVLVKTPASVSDEAALGEPMACLVNAQRRTKIELADRVAIVGLGFMGLGMLQLVKLRGPSLVVGVDVREEARARALELGADEVYHPADVPAGFLLTEFAKWNTPSGLDVLIEASGTQPGLTLAGKMVKAHGILSILGYHQGGMREVDVAMWNWKAIDMVNAHVRRRADLLESMRIGLALTEKGLLDLGRLATHRYSLDEVDQAYRDLRDKPAGFVKGVVYPTEGAAHG